MAVAAIKTEAVPWVPTSGQVNELIGMPMRVLAEFNFIKRESGAESQADKVKFSEQQEMCAAILNAFEEFTGLGEGSVTIAIPVDHDTPVLTEKQRRSIALVKKWMSEDQEEQTESMLKFMEAVDEDREGHRTLFKKK